MTMNDTLKQQAQAAINLYFANDIPAFKTEAGKMVRQWGELDTKQVLADVRAEREKAIADAEAAALAEREAKAKAMVEGLKSSGEKALELGLTVPAINPDWVDTPAFLTLLDYAANAGEYPHGVMLTGPHGTGKTETGMQFAARIGLPFHKVSMPLYRDALSLMGRMEAENATTVWHQSMLARLAELGGGVLMLDEINRCNTMVGNALLGLLDATRSVYVEETGKTLVRGKNLFIMSTANIGARYSGTTRLDAALSDRFSIKFETDYLPIDSETKLLMKRGLDQKQSRQLADFAGRVRMAYLAGDVSEPVTTRALLATADIYMALGSKHMAEVVNLTIINTYANDASLGANAERAKVLQMVQAAIS